MSIEPEAADAEILPAVISALPRETEAIVQQIRALAAAHCDDIEAAAFLGMLPDEFRLFLLANKRSAQAFFSGPATGRATLKVAQLKAAKAGDGRLLVWLGKQWLGQADKIPTPPEDPNEALRAAAQRDWDQLAPWRMQKLG